MRCQMGSGLDGLLNLVGSGEKYEKYAFQR